MSIKEMLGTIPRAMKVKAKMKERGLTAAKCRCPSYRKKAMAVARLAGRKQHLHLHCGECGYVLIE